MHIGADAGTGYVHTITGSAANVHDIEEAPKLFREDDNVGYGDSGYLGIEKRDEVLLYNSYRIYFFDKQ